MESREYGKASGDSEIPIRRKPSEIERRAKQHDAKEASKKGNADEELSGEETQQGKIEEDEIPESILELRKLENKGKELIAQKKKLDEEMEDLKKQEDLLDKEENELVKHQGELDEKIQKDTTPVKELEKQIEEHEKIFRDYLTRREFLAYRSDKYKEKDQNHHNQVLEHKNKVQELEKQFDSEDSS